MVFKQTLCLKGIDVKKNAGKTITNSNVYCFKQHNFVHRETILKNHVSNKV